MFSKKILILVQVVILLVVIIGCSKVPGAELGEAEQTTVVASKSKRVVIFDSKGITANPEPMTIEMYSTLKIDELPQVRATNYSFLGWHYKGKKICDEYMVDRNITLEAVWAKKEYNITYFDEDETVFSGKFSTNHPVKYLFDGETVLVIPSKSGFEFDGWYMDRNCAGKLLTKLDKRLYTNDIKLYAKWISVDCIRRVAAVDVANMIKDFPAGKVNYLKIQGVVTNEIIEQIKKALIANLSKMVSLDFTHAEGLTEIGYCAFAGCRNLVSMKLPDTVTKIRERGFVQCSGLKSISLGKSVTEIGNKAFGECLSLTVITIPNTVESIGDEAFISCEKLESIKFGKSVNKIGEYTFADCKFLKIVELPSQLKEISMGMFYGCSQLEKLIIPQNVEQIGCNVFGECGNLNSLIFLGQDCDLWFRSEIPNEGGDGFIVHELTVEHFTGDFTFNYWYKSLI